MRTTRIAFVATGLLALGAGIAIAGLPGPAPEAIVISPDRVTTTTATLPPPVEPGPDTTTTTVTTTTTTTPPTTTPPTTVPLLDRADLVVVVANGTGRGGVAAGTIDQLRPSGYDEMFPVDAVQTQPTSGVFHQPGLEGEAERLALDAGLDVGAIAPADAAPAVTGNNVFDLLLVVGRDDG